MELIEENKSEVPMHEDNGISTARDYLFQIEVGLALQDCNVICIL